MAEPTFAEQMVDKLETMLLANAGVAKVVIDGQEVAYRDLEVKYEYWKKKVAKEQGKAPVVSTIRLDRFSG